MPHEKGGFALVAALLFVFLIIGLLVTLISMTTVELKITDNASKLRQARSNALAGLREAINTLQINAGPDQSITATAGLLDTDPATSKIDNVANPWLTGVWSNRPLPQKHHRAAPLVWLISGAQPNANSTGPLLTPFTNLDDPSPVNDTTWLLRKTVGGDDTLSVKARKIAIKTKKPTRSSEPDKEYVAGHYAWWASDEGVKCRVNLPPGDDDNTSSTEAMVLAKWKLSAPRRAPWKVSGMSALPMDSPDYSKVLTLAQIPLLGPANQQTKLLSSLEKHFHDLTTDSYGVLSDCKEGGLKLDLSLAFEMADEEFEKDPYFSSVDGLHELMPTMRDYYRTYKHVRDPQNNPLLKGRPAAIKPENASDKALSEAANAYLDSANSIPAISGVNPVIMRLMYVYSLLSKSEPINDAGTPDCKLILVIDPVITLWNPYNLSLEFDAYRVDAWIPTAHLVIEKRDRWLAERSYETNDEVWHDRQLYQARSPNQRGEPPDKNKAWERLKRKWTLASDISLQKVFANHGASASSSFLMMSNAPTTHAPITMEPGEIIVFSPNGKQPQSGQNGDFQVHLQRGLNTQGGVSFEKLVASNANESTVNKGVLLVHGDSEIRVTIEPARDSNYRKEDPFDFITNYSMAGLDETPSPASKQPYRESLGYFKGGRDDSASLLWAGTRTGEAPDFTYSTRAYSGKDSSDKPLPGSSDTLKMGKQINETDKRFLGLIEWRLKTEADANGFPVQMIARFDPRCVFIRQPEKGYPCTIPTYQLNARKLTSSTSIIELHGDHGYWGSSNGASGEHYTPLFEIPTVPLLSLGQLQHYHAGVSARPEALNAGYVIGNSWAHAYVARHKKEEIHGTDGIIKDLSHQLNNKLFDRFYFSSITPRSGEVTINGRILDFTSETKPRLLPNPRMRRYLAMGQTTKGLGERLTNASPTLHPPAYKTVAANLLVEGAFNVNSTSVEAWKAVLASLEGTDMPVRDPHVPTTTLQECKGSPHARFTLSNGDSTKRWRGFRSISDTQLQSLAEAIVQEVKHRGPFSSLSDFVNRRLINNDSGLCGSLQAAINRTGINHEFTALVTPQSLLRAAQQGTRDNGRDWALPYPENTTGPIAAGAPGFLTQGDLLQALAPHLTARSDTFKVRAYGDVIHPITGKLEARAWCEAIVQRLPDYTNILENDHETPEPAWTSPADIKLDSNQLLGRRFRIVRIRWLSPEEV